VAAEAIVRFFRQGQTRMLIKRLEAAGVAMTQAAHDGPKPLSQMAFVFTGELQHMSRADAEALVRSLGGTASSSVSRLTSYVVAGASPGSKLAAAKTLGVRVLNETQFKQLIQKK